MTSAFWPLSSSTGVVCSLCFGVFYFQSIVPNWPNPSNRSCVKLVTWKVKTGLPSVGLGSRVGLQGSDEPTRDGGSLGVDGDVNSPDFTRRKPMTLDPGFERCQNKSLHTDCIALSRQLASEEVADVVNPDVDHTILTTAREGMY